MFKNVSIHTSLGDNITVKKRISGVKERRPTLVYIYGLSLERGF